MTSPQMPNLNMRRDLPPTDVSSSPPPEAKKRKLPAGWVKERKDDNDNDDDYDSDFDPPPQKELTDWEIALRKKHVLADWQEAALKKINKRHRKPVATILVGDEVYVHQAKLRPYQPPPDWLLHPEKVPHKHFIPILRNAKEQVEKALAKAKERVEELEEYDETYEEIIARADTHSH